MIKNDYLPDTARALLAEAGYPDGFDLDIWSYRDRDAAQALANNLGLGLGVAVSAQAIPNFWLGLMAIILLAVIYPIFPVSGDKTIYHFVLPSFVLGVSSVPPVMRLMRTGLMDVMGADFSRTARSKGYSGWRLVTLHAMRNALLPVVSVLAVQLGHKFGGSIITESVFAINGLGRLALESILGADIPSVQILVFVFAFIFPNAQPVG